jgi:radical SAM-linked protein
VQRLWVRYAKRGRLRFASHRDFSRALERALRRAGVPVAYSAGFTPHPKISYAGAAPTGAASAAEYLELALAEPRSPATVRDRLAEALPAGFDVVDVVEAGPVSLAERLQASRWQLVIDGVPAPIVEAAVTAFLARDAVEVQRLTKNGRRHFDAREPVVSATARAAGAPKSDSGASATGCSDTEADAGAPKPGCAILDLVVRHTTPVVRPDDVLTGLRLVAGFTPPVPPVATRLAQGPLDAGGRLLDPLASPCGAAGGERAAGERRRTSRPGTDGTGP